MVKKVVLTLIVAIALLFVGGWLALHHHAAAVFEPDYWEATIQSFEEADAGAPPQRQIVFIGSSSIRLWEDLFLGIDVPSTSVDIRKLPQLGHNA